MGIYLCYDVRGIQSFIFKIPKLKYIVGGSALIDQFDKVTIPGLSSRETSHIFSGGGKGTFLCDSKDCLNKLKGLIILKAHDIGLDIRFGADESFSKASLEADNLYSYIPDTNIANDRPCPESGLYPVQSRGKVHHVIGKRLFAQGEKVFRRFEQRLLSEVLIPGRPNDDLEFFHNVNADQTDGRAGAAALGNRNRWAVISMDGNDMGMQFRHQANRLENKEISEKEMMEWVKKMSQTLDSITTRAASKGVQRVVSEWALSKEGKDSIRKDKTVTLPIRPLLVGGDDIVILCHCSYAVTFVKEAIGEFETLSQRTESLWPATNGKLTISAGILFSSVTLPLHTAIPYCEAVLGSAKTRGRKDYIDGEPSPACIDWESVTESVIDTPAAKRQREMVFYDEAIDKTVKLTCRPYTMEEFSSLEINAEKYRSDEKLKIPRTTRHHIFSAFKKGNADRLAFYARIKKNYPDLFETINEFGEPGKSWTINKNNKEQSTDLIDALLLVEEDNRMSKGTVK